MHSENGVKQIRRNLEGYSVVIAEDDDTSYLYLHEVLKKSGMKIIRAMNGENQPGCTDHCADGLCFGNRQEKVC
jgi:hypothetical protein